LYLEGLRARRSIVGGVLAEADAEVAPLPHVDMLFRVQRTDHHPHPVSDLSSLNPQTEHLNPHCQNRVALLEQPHRDSRLAVRKPDYASWKRAGGKATGADSFHQLEFLDGVAQLASLRDPVRFVLLSLKEDTPGPSSYTAAMQL
jgi:hypothetical protein